MTARVHALRVVKYVPTIQPEVGSLLYGGIMGESEVLNIVRLEASKKRVYLWRNNVGATHTESGSFIRYGLANDSKAMNAMLKSGDLIGIRPITIEAWMIGGVIGQFVSRECKASTWKESKKPNAREKAQIAWRDLIRKLGGDAEIVTKEGSL